MCVFSSAVAVTQAIQARTVSCSEVLQAHLRRISDVNTKLNAVVALDTDRAMAEASRLDARLARGETVGPLHGLPVTIKDSLDTKGLVSTGGTVGRRTYVPTVDATVVARLRAAGAVVVGKTNTPELTPGRRHG